MSKDVIMPALGMAQETGTLIRWLKAPGESVAKGEPLMEIETDKATVEIEAPAAGVLADVTAQPGDVVAVGKTIAVILAPGEAAATRTESLETAGRTPQAEVAHPEAPKRETPHRGVSTGETGAPTDSPTTRRVPASPLAARMAAEHGLDLAQIKPSGDKVQKDDVLAYLAAREAASSGERGGAIESRSAAASDRKLASPKARRLAQERGLNLAGVIGSGPQGAVLAADVMAAGAPKQTAPEEMPEPVAPHSETPQPVTPEWETPQRETSQRGLSTGAGMAAGGQTVPMSRTWQVTVERLSQAWATIPHFYLLREVNATRLAAWRAEAQARASEKITYTDLLVKVTAAALRRHPRLNAAWHNDGLVLNSQVSVGLAVAIDDGLVVPVIHDADMLGLAQIAARRAELVARAQARKLAPDDLSGGTFTISNLGMYGVDAFIAVVNPPQAAILSAGRIAERVVPVNGQPAVAPMLTLGLSCDHRVVDGARAAQFLQTLAEGLEAPLSLLD